MSTPNSRDYILTQIKNYRLERKLSQADVGLVAKKTRPWVTLVENGTFNPIVFFDTFCALYGVDEAKKVYGVDWRLYTGEKIALYFTYYQIKKKLLAAKSVELGQSSLRNIFLKPRSHFDGHKEAIDKLFPNIEEDIEDIFNYHLIGKNSLCHVVDGIPIIYLNYVKNRSMDLDDETTQEEMIQDAKTFVKFHEVNKSFGEMKRYVEIPYSKLSYSKLSARPKRKKDGEAADIEEDDELD